MDVRVWILLLASAAGCAQRPAGEEIGLPPQIEFWTADKTRAFVLEAKDGAIRVENGTGTLLAVLRVGEESLEIENGVGGEIGLVVPPSDEHRGVRILGPDRGRALFEFRSEPDGDFKVKNAKGRTLYNIQKRDYGLKVVKRNGKVESRIRSEPGKISVRDRNGTTFLHTRDRLPEEAVAALVLDGLPFEYAAGLAVAILHWAPPPDVQD